MTTQETIDELKKVIYVAKLKKLDNEHIDVIKRATLLLKNYMEATKLYLEADRYDKEKRKLD